MELCGGTILNSLKNIGDFGVAFIDAVDEATSSREEVLVGGELDCGPEFPKSSSSLDPVSVPEAAGNVDVDLNSAKGFRESLFGDGVAS